MILSIYITADTLANRILPTLTHLILTLYEYITTVMRIGIVGHSQVPLSIDSPSDTVSIFRKPGAKILNWRNIPELTAVFEHNFDLVFIWLGSNDISETCVTAQIFQEINHFASLVETRCNTKVILVEIENRHYTSSRFYVNPERYQRIKRHINQKLRLQRVYTLANFGAFKFTLGSDGVHFTTHAKQLVREKFVAYIEKFRAGLLY